jgi:hypothetical protein|tara:strand:+ start:1357 stop:1770 length:414 start_codon:yes stop_codon:yes gene_type:complete
MSEDYEFEGKDDLKELFEKILGSNIILKDTLEVNEASVFCLIVNKLDAAHKDDEALFELSGIDLTKSKNELWFVIESLLKISYGNDAFDMIMWYILDRFNPDGKVVPFEDENGKQFSLLTSKDLFEFLKHRFPTKLG